MMKEVSDMELQTVNATTVQARECRWKYGGSNVSERDGTWTEVQVTNRTDNEEWGNNGSFML